ncbi:hypothetical protein GIY21_01900 [Xanthomonas sontii]|uniref:Uncharacterized protein n=1 Tax=Xanthomonas sontii TaxID=2650745 RepID=A0A6N7Q9W5_9XANT|nr:hypothetical protein [Xanthomonas sontii]MRG99044.1 hypothetical protein [Xanthomonas sontii]MRH73165.1 hypothetical protein [Xanthomonas sontii]
MRIRSRGVARFPLWLALCLAMPFAAGAAGAAPQAPTPAAPAAAANADALPPGEWSGTLALDAQRLAAVRLAQRDGKARLMFGSPLNCALLVKPQPGAGFALESINGGAYCDKLMGKPLRVQRSGDDLRLNVDGKDLPVVLHGDPGQPSPLQGTWRGVTRPDYSNRGVAVQLSVAATPQAPGSATVQLRYGAPRECRVQGRYLGMREGDALYTLDMDNQGVCTRLSDGQLTLRARPDGELELQTVDGGGKGRESALLERVPANP